MAVTVFTGWRTVTPGPCRECGTADDWECDGRGNITCSCQACCYCASRDVYGFHEPGCLILQDAMDTEAAEWAALGGVA